MTAPTPRQRQIYRLYAAGKTIDQIAAELNLSPGTVYNHLHRHAKKHRRPTKRDR